MHVPYYNNVVVVVDIITQLVLHLYRGQWYASCLIHWNAQKQYVLAASQFYNTGHSLKSVYGAPWNFASCHLEYGLYLWGR